MLVMYITGETLSSVTSLSSVDDAARHRLAQRLLAATLAQIMEAGVFHSDLHPGNIVIADGALVLLDFGLIGRIDSETLKPPRELVVRLFSSGCHRLH